MATPALSRHVLPGALGEILVDVRAGGRTSPRPAVVVVHGFKGFKDWGFFPPFAERAARSGLVAVTFNLSGSGVDGEGRFTRLDRFRSDTFSAELADVRSVLAALRAGTLDVVPPSRIGLVGHSRGGGIALLAAAGDPDIAALVTWAAVASLDRWTGHDKEEWRSRGFTGVLNTRTGEVLSLGTEILDDLKRNGAALDLGAAARRVAVPWLIIHGMDDETVSVSEAEALFRSADPAVARRLLVPGTGHTFGAVHPWTPPAPQADRLFDATLEFLAGPGAT